jgi:tetratricopeptide (TPR) repeat protein
LKKRPVRLGDSGDGGFAMAIDAHPSCDELERFMLGELAPDVNRRVLRHLLADCAHCHETTGLLWEIGGDEEAAVGSPGQRWEAANRSGYDLAIDRVFQKVRQANGLLETERAQARQLFEELSRHPLERQRLLVQNSTRFQSWGFCELLLNLSQEGRFADPQEGAKLAEIAVAVAESLDPAVYGPALLQDLKARAWSFLGNAKRVLSDFRAAEHVFHVAESHLARGTGDRLEKARLLDLKASLRNYQGRSEEAIALLNRVIAIYQRAKQKHLLGRALLNKGHVCIWAGDLETAIALLRQGLTLTDPLREAKLVLTAQHNIAYVLNELGRHEEALAMVARSRGRYAELGDALNLVRLQFLEAKIALAMGRLEQAEAGLQEVRRAFSERGMAYDVALASLDLAEVYARLERHPAVVALAREMVTLFQSREQHREAIAAVIVFQQAVEAERATVEVLEVIHRAAGELQKLRRGVPAAAL